MGEEEKTIEININLDKPLLMAFLLIIIIIEAGYIGYLHLSPKGEPQEPPFNHNETETTNATEVPETPSSNFTEPETFEELKAGLIAAGVKNIVKLDPKDWQGKHLEVSYIEALELAKKAAFVGVDEEVVAFLIYIDKEFYIWFPS